MECREKYTKICITDKNREEEITCILYNEESVSLLEALSDGKNKKTTPHAILQAVLRRISPAFRCGLTYNQKKLVRSLKKKIDMRE